MIVKVIFNDVRGQTVNNLTNLVWTHVLVQVGAAIYEATWPVVRKSYVLPPASKSEILEFEIAPNLAAKMVVFGEKNLGSRYMLRYLIPSRFGKVRGLYCSEFAYDILRVGGFKVSPKDGYTPDALLEALVP
jgi:hypothetical protein